MEHGNWEELEPEMNPRTLEDARTVKPKALKVFAETLI